MGTGQYVVAVERMYGTDCASRFLYLRTRHSSLHYICMQLAVLVSFTRFTVLIENDSAQLIVK